MSEVYIRSQNKEKLYRLGGNYACVEYGEYEDIKKKRGGAEADKKRHVICISDGCLEEIGEYATKERCLEVLDEIQKACVSYLFTAGGAAVIRGGMDVGFELYEWQRLYIITGIWQPPEGRLHGRTTAYILRLLLDQSKPLLLYEFSQVAAYADNPFMGRQYQPVPMQYAGWFRHEIRSIYEQLRAAGVPVREMITEQQRVISW